MERGRRLVNDGRADGGANGTRRRRWLRGSDGRLRRDEVLPLAARLKEIEERIPPSRIDAVWIFPPLPEREISCEFIVLSCFDGPERRRIITAHVEARPSESDATDFRWVQRMLEHGAAPEGWVSGMPDRLLGRLSDAGVPQVMEIGGEPRRWLEAVHALANGNGGAGNGGAGNGGAGDGNGLVTKGNGHGLKDGSANGTGPRGGVVNGNGGRSEAAAPHVDRSPNVKHNSHVAT